MKLIYIHIPKTGGSTISDALNTNKIKGHWLLERDLWGKSPDEIWHDNDLLAGHFTLRNIYKYTTENNVDMSETEIVTVFRDPIQQLRSNLNYPFELQSRNIPLNEQWMNELISLDQTNIDEVIAFLMKYNWILNQQTKYVLESDTEYNLHRFSRIGIFPNLEPIISFLNEKLGIKEPIRSIPHKNQSESHLNPYIFEAPEFKVFLNDAHWDDINLWHSLTSKAS